MGRAIITRLPNTLARQIGPRARIFTATLLGRAEAALQRISASFPDWLGDDVEAFVAAADTFRQNLQDGGRKKNLWSAAVQLEGSGAAFGYPVVARLAHSLSALLARDDFPVRLLEAHVDAVIAAGRTRALDESDPVSREICITLEARVAELSFTPKATS